MKERREEKETKRRGEQIKGVERRTEGKRRRGDKKCRSEDSR